MTSIPRKKLSEYVVHMYGKDPFTAQCGQRFNPEKDAVTVSYPKVTCGDCKTSRPVIHL